MNCLYSFRTENKIETPQKVCENKDFCSVEIPAEETKILELNQYHKSDNTPFIVYEDFERLIEKIDGRKKHLNTKPTFKAATDKRAQALSLEHPENVGLTIWSSFEKVFLDIASLLVEETKKYDNRDKNKQEFNVKLNEMLNLVGLIFYYLCRF